MPSAVVVQPARRTRFRISAWYSLLGRPPTACFTSRSLRSKRWAWSTEVSGFDFARVATSFLLSITDRSHHSGSDARVIFVSTRIEFLGFSSSLTFGGDDW